MKRKTLISVFISASAFCFAQKSKMPIDNSFKDTAKFSILSYQNIKPYELDISSVDAKLTKSEIKQLEKLFFKAVENYNLKTSKYIDSVYKNKKQNHEIKRDMLVYLDKEFYFKQLFPVTSARREKIVWVNCFLADLNNLNNTPKYYFVDVADGLNNYFSVYINLTTNTFSGMRIHPGG